MENCKCNLRKAVHQPILSTWVPDHAVDLAKPDNLGSTLGCRSSQTCLAGIHPPKIVGWLQWVKTTLSLNNHCELGKVNQNEFKLGQSIATKNTKYFIKLIIMFNQRLLLNCLQIASLWHINLHTLQVHQKMNEQSQYQSSLELSFKKNKFSRFDVEIHPER